MATRYWTHHEVATLLCLWGHKPLDEIARAVGRSPKAVQIKAQKLNLGSPNNGWLTLSDVSRMSGYSTRSIEKAANALGIRLQRGLPSTARLVGLPPRKRRYRISEEDAQKLTEWCLGNIDPQATKQLGPNHKWAACRECGATGVEHAARGLCRRCYRRWHYRTYIAPKRAAQRAAQRAARQRDAADGSDSEAA
jgi:hypothetical protein